MKITDKAPKLPSEKSFGLFFSSIGMLIFALQAFFAHRFPLWILFLSSLLCVIALIAPSLLRPLNMAWFYLGKVLHNVMNPLIMAIIFFGLFTPIGKFRQLLRKDKFSKNYNPELKSYWLQRSPPGPSPSSLSNQF